MEGGEVDVQEEEGDVGKDVRIQDQDQDPGSIVEVSKLTKEIIPSSCHVSHTALILSSPGDVEFHYWIDRQLLMGHFLNGLS